MVQLFLSNDKTGWSWAAGIYAESGGRLVGAAAEDIRRVGVRAHGVRTVKSAYLVKYVDIFMTVIGQFVHLVEGEGIE